ncbi:Ldh family oxidoreductase [Acrocarpospora macrocephala]|uniref:Lactate dehydrogenase n=1 Tax=Acrocarpospora macrocephala TaxID=150177 RepID=A0A5M3WT29_9ACTN|nr:Ldh family oxidoreductase [Acrocarpospora macrocephala]GES09783.1 lactate dehydrogenase [Acrocarpospora macrocephala]
MIPAPDLITFGTRVLTSVGVPEPDARLVADSLVTADMWGHPSHGMLRLGWYVDRIRGKVMRAATEVVTVTDGGAVAVLDGQDGVGQVVTAHAAREAVRRAGEHGVGVVAVRNSNHFGTAAYFTRMIAAQGCVAVLTTNGSPAMAPWGGRAKTVGANPWSIAVPGGRRGPVVLDIANTTVARGKIYAALEREEPVPEGWALAADGTPTTDPRQAIDGLILPMAGHKGYGISFMMDVLSGVLTGSSYAGGVAGPYVPDRRSGCGHLVLALRVDAVHDPQEYGRRLDDLIDRTKEVPLAPGFEEIFYPGEIEERKAHDAERGGVSLPDKTLRDLSLLGEECHVPLPEGMAACSS